MGCMCVVDERCFHTRNEFELQGECFSSRLFVSKASFLFFIPLPQPYEKEKKKREIYWEAA